jgi:hypothetical protein
MASAPNPKDQAHDLIDRMSSGQVRAVVGLLQAMLDPAALALADAPLDDESIEDDENRRVAAAKAWLETNAPLAHEQVLAEFGLSPQDFARMAATPLKPDSRH